MFMKILIVTVTLMGLAAAQRGSYAGSRPIGRPDLASRFKDDNEASSTVGVDNRLGVGSSSSTERIPVDARGDHDLVNRLNQWPRENRPFWLINAEHIEAQRNRRPTAPSVQTANRFGETDNGVIPIRPTNLRPSFAGPAN